MAAPARDSRGKRTKTETLAREQPVYNRLSVLRAERGLSRKDLAESLGVHYQTIGFIERGDFNPSLELALRLSEFFALPIEAIFSRQPFRPMSETMYERTERGDA